MSGSPLRGEPSCSTNLGPMQGPPVERISVGDLAGQQRFLAAVAACVETTSLPVHARPVLLNLRDGKFEKLSFLTGTLRGLLDKPAEVNRGIRAGSIFMMPLYIWIMVFVGSFQDNASDDLLSEIAAVSALVVGGAALVQLLGLLFRTTIGHAIFRLAVINAQGAPATISHLLARWAIAWLPLILPMSIVALLTNSTKGAAIVFAFVLLLLWVAAAAYAVIHPHRGLHDRLARTWVVRR